MIFFDYHFFKAKKMASIIIAQQIIGIILNNYNIQQSSTTEFDDMEICPNIQEIVELIKQHLPNCEILETSDDYIMIRYANRTIRCGY